MSKHKILFASSLKPAFDIRSEKLYQSFKNDSTYDCYFCGVVSKTTDKNLNTHTWKYGRGLIFRLMINFSYFFLLLKIKPRTIILNNNDLQLLSIYYKLIFGAKVIYDVQENLVYNITYQNIYSGWKKQFYLLLTNLSNNSLGRFCNGFILAEKCYEEELPFIKKKPYLILENKFLPPRIEKNKNNSSILQLLFSGTITETSGIQNALIYLRELNKIRSCQLTIIGHTPDKNLHKKLKSISDTTVIYQGSTSPIPHNLINQAISKADFGLICYVITDANKNKIPTKIYEYLANQLPIICQKHSAWNYLIKTSKGGITFSNTINNSIVEQKFYTNKNTEFAFWKEQPFTKWVQNI